MIEANAFLVAFAAQVLAASVLFSSRLIRYVRGWTVDFGSERFSQLYPGVDFSRSVERFVTGYRAANIVIALFGLALLGWLFTRIPHPGWVSEVSNLTFIYFFLQMTPMLFVALYAIVRFRKALMQPSQGAKRTATLQRRGLFDFVSPFAVFFAVLSYFLFVVFAIYLDLHVYHNTTLSKPCVTTIGSVTLVYVLNAFVVFKYLYGRKNPLVTHEGRAHMIGATIKGMVYSSIAVTWWSSIFGALGQPGLQEWRPFALAVLFVISTLLSLSGVTAPARYRADAHSSASSLLPNDRN